MAAIVNYRDLLLQGSATRYISAGTPITAGDLGDLAYLDQVGTGQIQPGSITASSGIVAPGAILTQALAPNATAIVKSYSSNGPTLIGTNIADPDAAEVPIATFPTYGSKGGTVLICFGMRTSWSGSEPELANIHDNKLIVRRNGFLIYTLDQISHGILTIPPVIDTTVSGTPVSYTISIKPYSFWSTGGVVSWYCNERSAYLLESFR